MCAVQSSSINVTSDTGHPVRTLVPVSLYLHLRINMLLMNTINDGTIIGP